MNVSQDHRKKYESTVDHLLQRANDRDQDGFGAVVAAVKEYLNEHHGGEGMEAIAACMGYVFASGTVPDSWFKGPDSNSAADISAAEAARGMAGTVLINDVAGRRN
jgi:hypothetical protein